MILMKCYILFDWIFLSLSNLAKTPNCIILINMCDDAWGGELNAVIEFYTNIRKYKNS